MKAYIVSLGCPKNLVDTQGLMSKLLEQGYSFTHNPKQANLILINTCAFIQSAKEESIDTILELARFKKQGRCKHLIVAGCLPQRYKQELPALLPEVDAFIGTPRKFGEREKVRLTPPWTAYVKISEGCNNCCSYCTIPKIRGRLRHRAMKDILAEIKLLAKSGLKEVIFVAQDTTAYPNFHLLLKRAAKIPGIRWLRIMYAHPAHLSDKLIATIAREKKIVKYLDLPIQHVNAKILSRMKRPAPAGQALENLILKIRRRIPKIALRTSVIVGFPGEGEAEFLELLDFIKKVKFDRLGVFTFSREEGTPAAKMRGQVSEKKKQARVHRLMRAQARLSRELNKKLIGRPLEILVESSSRGRAIGRSFMDAPEIDGQVVIKKTITPGEIVSVKITRAKTYDLIGTLI